MLQGKRLSGKSLSGIVLTENGSKESFALAVANKLCTHTSPRHWWVRWEQGWRVRNYFSLFNVGLAATGKYLV